MSALRQHDQPILPFVDPDLLRIAKAVRDEHADCEVPEDQRALVRGSYTIRRFYEEWLEPARLKRVESRKLSSGSLAKDRQALNRWEALTRPPADQWPAEKPWHGVPLGYITGGYLDEFLTALRDAYAEATAYSTWTHLRTMLNAAVRLRVLDAAPVPKDTPRMDSGTVEIYGTSTAADGGLTRAYTALAEHLLLQTAFVLAVNAGPRSIDLFLLRWEDFDLTADRPALDFESRKTKKKQRIPLAPCTVAHLRRLQQPLLFPDSGGLVFPRLSSPDNAHPEKSREARHRNAVAKALLAKAGFAFEKPWQAARATCNERYESHKEGVGQFLLGHSRKTINARSYRRPTQTVYDAVHKLPQPACFDLS